MVKISMLMMRGAPALSGFRIQKLLNTLNDSNVPALAISANFMHFTHAGEKLSEKEQHVLAALLQYGPTLDENEAKGRLFLVTPRPGTLSRKIV